jgi:hypothetical protein
MQLKWIGHSARMEGTKNAYKILIRRPEKNKSLGKPRCSWEDMKQAVGT